MCAYGALECRDMHLRVVATCGSSRDFEHGAETPDNAQRWAPDHRTSESLRLAAALKTQLDVRCSEIRSQLRARSRCILVDRMFMRSSPPSKHTVVERVDRLGATPCASLGLELGSPE